METCKCLGISLLEPEARILRMNQPTGTLNGLMTIQECDGSNGTSSEEHVYKCLTHKRHKWLRGFTDSLKLSANPD